ncbi:hypothetical protein Aduo_008578 [Ancylostoma duodenale]
MSTIEQQEDLFGFSIGAEEVIWNQAFVLVQNCGVVKRATVKKNRRGEKERAKRKAEEPLLAKKSDATRNRMEDTLPVMRNKMVSIADIKRIFQPKNVLATMAQQQILPTECTAISMTKHCEICYVGGNQASQLSVEARKG